MHGGVELVGFCMGFVEMMVERICNFVVSPCTSVLLMICMSTEFNYVILLIL